MTLYLRFKVSENFAKRKTASENLTEAARLTSEDLGKEGEILKTS